MSDDKPSGRRRGKAGIPGLIFFLVFAGFIFTRFFNDFDFPESRHDPATTLSIVSGSENKSLEPIVTEFCQAQGWHCDVHYQGSVDIKLALEEEEVPFDAVWPAHSRWVELGDGRRRVKHLTSISSSPVVFAVVDPVAERLGLKDRPVATADLVDLVRSGQLDFIMTSATQSNSGFSMYLAMLHALAGTPEVLSTEMLANQGMRTEVSTLLKGVERTSGSSGWLADLYLEGAEAGDYQAMVNYEAIIIETNEELVRRGLPTLYALYPTDGVAVADSPLGFVATGENAAKEDFFLELQAHLTTPEVQRELIRRGRRTGFGGTLEGADPAVFNPAWGIDASKTLSAIRFPEPETIEEALALFQETLRRPSLTALCLDFSGSMDGNGATQLKSALTRLFDPATSRRFLLQPSAEDRTVAIRFSSRPGETIEARGPAELVQLAARVQAWEPGGGTDIYSCAQAALAWLDGQPEIESHIPAVVLMTDGKSDGDFNAFQAMYRNVGRDIPVHAITFGNADPSQLEAIAGVTRARVFDGRKDLARAFRRARGYN